MNQQALSIGQSSNVYSYNPSQQNQNMGPVHLYSPGNDDYNESS
jgi:hypothetical protein